MRIKRTLIALLVLIIGTSTLGAAYRLITNDRYDMPVSSTTEVSVSPTNITLYLEIGKTFTVNITITSADDLYVWQAGINFNATLLEALSFEEGPFLKQKGTTLWTPGTIDNTLGTMHYHASALAGNVMGVDGNGTLGTVTFRIKSYGNSTLQLTDVILLNSSLTDMDKTLVHGTVKIKLLGDVDSDGKVDAHDLFALAKAYGSDPSKPNWNQDCDFNGDQKIDASDLLDLSQNYGKTT